MASIPTFDDELGAAAPAPAPGRIAGRYEVRGLLGAGAFGAVYRAFDTDLQELVAVKLLRAVTNPAALAAFRREVKLARQVAHPNVVRTFEVGEHTEDDGNVVRFLTMELVDGPSLARRLAEQGPVPLRELARIGVGIADGVAAAHRFGVLHRDLKPDNVLLAADGRALITDFGIARAADEAGPVGVAGTPGYMAPEQGAGGELGPAADVHALGALLLELATGRRPVRGGDGAARDPVGDLPPAFADLVARCLRVDPAGRPTAEEVSRELGALAGLSGRPAAPAPGRLARSAPRAPIVAVAPIADLSGPGGDWLATGLAEDLLDHLASVPGLRVAPIRDRGRDVGDEAARIGAHALLEGSLRRLPDGSLRLSARLLDTAEGFQLWTRRAEGQPPMLLGAIRGWAVEVGDALGVHARRAPGHPAEPEVVEAFLRARERMRVNDLEEALACLDRALARTPDDPVMLALVATLSARSTFYATSRDIDPVARIRRCEVAARRALALAPDLADAWLATASARSLAGDLVGAARAVKTAVALAPGNARAQETAGWLLTEVDRLDDAEHRLRGALALDPSQLALGELIRNLALQRRWAEVDAAVAAYPRDVSGGPGIWMSLLRFSMWSPERPMPPTPNGADAFGELARVVGLVRSGGPFPPGSKEIALARASGGSLRTRANMGQFMAEITAAAGLVDDAFELLDFGLGGPLVDLAWADRCPVLGPLRADPRWAPRRDEIARRAGLVRAALDGPPEPPPAPPG